MKQEGDRRICKECNVEIHVERRNDSFGERLSWRNADGSAHFSKDGEQIIHTPTKSTPEDVWKEEIEERLLKMERKLGIMWYGE